MHKIVFNKKTFRKLHKTDTHHNTVFFMAVIYIFN